MTTQAMKNISVDFADTTFIQFKYGGKLYEYDDVENYYEFVKWIEKQENYKVMMEEELLEDIATHFINEHFEKLGDLLTKCEIVD